MESTCCSWVGDIWSFAADVAGASLPFLATGGAASGLGLGARAAVAALTGGLGQGGADYLEGKPASTMASTADQFMPTAKIMGGGAAGAHGLFSSLPPWAVNIGGGALTGRELGEVLGQPHLGMALGVAGGAARSIASPFINAGRLSAQAADRMAQAKALTGEPTQALANALKKRAAMGQITAGPVPSILANALARAAARTALPSVVGGVLWRSSLRPPSIEQRDLPVVFQTSRRPAVSKKPTPRWETLSTTIACEKAPSTRNARALAGKVQDASAIGSREC